MGRPASFDSKWVVDRKFFNGTTWILRYTACSNPKCASCRGKATVPIHGPYWAFYAELDGRSRLRHHSVREPLPWGDEPPPSLLPSEADPMSRRNVARAKREAAAEARTRARVAAAQERVGAAQAATEAKAKRRQDRLAERLLEAEDAVRRILANLADAGQAGHERRAERLAAAATKAQTRLQQLRGSERVGSTGRPSSTGSEGVG